jgi:cobalt/nickel transport system permease protein
MSESAARWLDRLGYGDSPAHRLDPRAKLVATLVFVACVASFPKYEVPGLLPFLAFPVALGAAGAVPVRPVLRVLAAASPFALLVGAWNPWLDPAPRAHLGSLPIAGGWISLLSLALRFALCTGAALVLVATTPMPGLLRGLRQLGLPRPFVAQLQLLYRYLFLLSDEAERIGRSRALRDPRRRLPRLGTAKRMLSALLWRTWERGERIYQCMQARGFQGDLPLLAPARFGAADGIFLASAVAACLLGRVLPLARWLGAAVAPGAGA